MINLAHISLGQFERMIEAGVFESDDAGRVELIRGRIYNMTPINNDHACVVTNLSEWGHVEGPLNQIRVRVQCPILLPQAGSVPQPDIAWVKRQKYDRHPLPEDVLLLIEVADSTIADDLGTKRELYAEDGIVEYWVVNIPAKAVHVYRQPGKGDYVDVQVLTAEDELRPRDFPDVMITPNRIFDY